MTHGNSGKVGRQLLSLRMLVAAVLAGVANVAAAAPVVVEQTNASAIGEGLSWLATAVIGAIEKGFVLMFR